MSSKQEQEKHKEVEFATKNKIVPANENSTLFGPPMDQTFIAIIPTCIGGIHRMVGVAL